MTEKRIRKAFEHVAPDHLNDVMEQCNAQKQQQKGKILSMTNKTPAPKRSRLPRILAAAAALVLLLTGTAVYGLNTRVCATVALDVNPSIELNVNRRERVVSVSPINNDGKQILGDMDLTGSDLQVAVNALVGSMLRQGYLSELSNSILISVDSSDPSESAALQERLTQEVAALLDTNSFSGAVLSQTVTTDAELSSLAEQYGLTPGKAQLIRRITESHPQHTFEDLAGLSVNELNLLLSSAPNAAESSTSSAVSSTGRASDRAYIGSEQALSIALTAAGLTKSEIVHPEIEMDYEHGRMIYDVEFKAGGREYDCEIDALTGEILKSETEPAHEDHAAASASAALLSAEKARDIALKHAGVASSDVRSWDCDLDDEHGRKVYEVEFKAGGREYDCEIDALTGEILKAETESAHEDHAAASASSALLSAEKARDIALKHAGVASSDVRSWDCDLDDEHGRKVYEVEFKAGNTEYDYEIDAVSGEILQSNAEPHDAQPKETHPNTDTVSSGRLSESEVRSIVLKHANVSSSEVTNWDCELDTDDGVTIFEIEFKAGGYEYDYEVNAMTGSILQYDRELDD